VSYESLLTHRARIEERSKLKDRLGQVAVSWKEKAANVSCRLSNARGGEVFTDRSRNVVRADYTLYFPEGTDIHETDRVAEVVDSAGAVLAINLNVLLVRTTGGLDGRSHHLECPCVVIRGET
jgi:hypothetical protein